MPVGQIPDIAYWAFVSEIIAIIAGLAMFLLVIWQAPRQRDNQLMALYMLSLIFWGAANFLARVQYILGFDNQLLFYCSALGIAFNGISLFLLASHYAGLWDRPLVKAMILAEIVFLAVVLVLLFQGKVVRFIASDTADLLNYELLPFGYLLFAWVFFYYLTAVAILWQYRRQRAGALLIGGILVCAGVFTDVVPGLKDLPLDIFLAAISSIFFAHAILNEKLFNPLEELNQNLSTANQELATANLSLAKANENLRQAKATTEVRAEQLATLNRVTQAVSGTRELQPALEFVAHEITQIFTARHTGIAILQPEKMELHVVADYSSLLGNPSDLGDAFRLVDSPLFARVAETGKSVIVSEAQSDPLTRPQHSLLQALQVQCFMLTPLFSRGNLIGTIGVSLSEAGRIFTSAEVALAETIAGQIAPAVENARLFEQMQVAKNAAEAANAAKSVFLANMSHELRTPLNAIIGYSEMLMEEVEDLENPGLIPDLERIEAAGRHLLAIINDILDLSKIEAGKMGLHLERFDLDPFINDIVTTIQPLMNKNGNKFQAVFSPGLGEMYADETKVRQILFNLLYNASKFTDHGSITLKVERSEIEAVELASEWVIFTVTDTGIGMGPQQVEKLFQPFNQADLSTTRKYGGTGLGLAISSHFCKMMGGEIQAMSQLGQGSTFRVRLPVKVNHPSGIEPRIRPNRWVRFSNNANRVLVIDDDPGVRELLQTFLREEGFHVVSAASGEEGLRLARALHPSVITLDVFMSELDGWEVLATLKSSPETVDIPVQMITVAPDRHEGYALDAADYVLKPVDYDQLVRVTKPYKQGMSDQAVMLITDDAEMRDQMGLILEQEGWSVQQVEDGPIGFALLANERPQVILLDLMMAEVDGFEIVSEIRRNESLRTVPIIVLAARDLTPEDRQRLNRRLEMILQKGAYSQERLLGEVQKLVMACVFRNLAATIHPEVK